MGKSLLTIPLGILMGLLAFYGLYTMTTNSLAGIGILGVVALVTLWNTLYTVNQQEVAILTMFGKFIAAGRAGLNFKIPYLVNIHKGNFSMQTREAEVPIDNLFTKNNVPVTVVVAVQYFVEDKMTSIRDACFKLQRPETQIESYVETAVRTRVAKYDFDELNAKQLEIAAEIDDEIGAQLAEYGYLIKTTLLKSLQPDQKVRDAMSDVAAADYEKRAATARGEAGRILQEKDGEGMGDKRKAMMMRLKEGLDRFTEGTQPTEAELQRIHELITLSVTADALTSMASSPGTHTIFTPGMSLGGADQLRQAILEADAARR